MTLDPGTILGLLRVLANLGNKGAAISGLGGGDATGGLGLLSSLLGLGSGIASGNTGQATGSGINAVGQAANLAGYPGVGALTGPAAALAGLATGNYGSAIGAIPSAASGLGSVLGSSLLSGIGGAAALPVAAIGMGLANEKAQQANRMSNIVREQQRFAQNYREGLPRMASGAQHYDDPMEAYIKATEGIQSVGPMAPAAGHSGTTTHISGGTLGGEKSMKYPDYSNPIAIEQALYPLDIMAQVRARDALARAGIEPTHDQYGYITPEDAFKHMLNVFGPTFPDARDAQGKLTKEGSESVRARSADPTQPYYQEWVDQSSPLDAAGLPTGPGGYFKSMTRPDIRQKLDAIKPGEWETGLLDIINSLGGGA